MKIALFGATGTIGQRILAEAVKRGHSVTAIARNPGAPVVDPDVLFEVADILDPASIVPVAKHHDAVVNAFGPRGGEAPDAVVKAAHALIEALPKAGVKRLIVVGGAGSLEVAPGKQLVDTPEFPEAWKPIALAARDALDVYRKEAGALDWTYFSPAALIQPGERTGKFRLGGDQLVTDGSGESKISAEDFAVALVDELEKPAHVKQRMTIGY